MVHNVLAWFFIRICGTIQISGTGSFEPWGSLAFKWLLYLFHRYLMSLYLFHRYLMSPCDTPSVLHSGTRSNALHIAALSGSVKMTQRVIDAIQDPDLMIRMYPGESGESRYLIFFKIT